MTQRRPAFGVGAGAQGWPVACVSRPKHSGRQVARGFSLLEVLGALALMALLLLGIYSGVRTATRSVRAGGAAVERLDQLRSTQQFMRQELAQIQAVPQSRDANGDSIFFVGDAQSMRFVAPLPGYLGKLGPQLQEWKLVSNGKGGSRLEVSFALLPPDGSKPKPVGEPEVLMDDVREGHFSYRTPDTPDQPGTWQPTWPDPRMLPRVVRVELKLDGLHDWPRLDAPLRIDPTAGLGQQMDMLRGLRRQPVTR
ncbi:prepilin-type N-terminal cleavage/methylation domain-containing protein [Dyella sp. BiH032]|uniref:prepilin-type N-terminal cleavage/methylation domain-containing protein n=1 Tax=Dyella sp. BiH032 TaxID=3075430 RepID=UPI00289381BA|nr:prepilin-type N-terminal cleavage/methylation domain-containing protein [Dyella sp. BiH032]WNL46691.1 prepilin-type N-terminal cleavage/methylation domain-containing protein [Dyella sp. BiH032]